MSVKSDFVENTLHCVFAGLLGSGTGALAAATIATAPITLPVGALGGALSLSVIMFTAVTSLNRKNDKTVAAIVKIAFCFFLTVASVMCSGASFPLASVFTLLFGAYTVSVFLFLSLFDQKAKIA